MKTKILKKQNNNHLPQSKSNLSKPKRSLNLINEQSQKVTIHIPKHLLQSALEATHKNITETIKDALQQFSQKNAYENLRKSRGKIKFSITAADLRRD
jgi:hypothetical protein